MAYYYYDNNNNTVISSILGLRSRSAETATATVWREIQAAERTANALAPYSYATAKVSVVPCDCEKAILKIHVNADGVQPASRLQRGAMVPSRRGRPLMMVGIHVGTVAGSGYYLFVAGRFCFDPPGCDRPGLTDPKQDIHPLTSGECGSRCIERPGAAP